MRILALAAGGVAAIALLAAACGHPQPAARPTPRTAAMPTMAKPAPGAPAPRVEQVDLRAVGLDPDAIDRTADPCNDFYQFACGEWIKKAQIPPDRAMTSRGFIAIADRNEEVLHRTLEQARTDPGGDPVSQKLGAFYGACMDEPAIEKAGLTGIQPLQKVIGQVKDKKTLLAALIQLHRREIWPLFAVGPEQDFKDATRMLAEVDQSGLGLPDRDYYFREDDRSKKLRAVYLDHIAAMLQLTGVRPKEAKAAAEDVLRLETEIARASKTLVERRDPAGMYNKIDRTGLTRAAPAIDWDAYLDAMSIPRNAGVNVTSVPYLEAIDGLIESTRPAVWKSYLTWHLLRGTSSLLPRAFQDEAFRMESAITGQKELRPRWKRCIAMTDAGLGELLAQPFVKERFHPEAKAATERYVAEISRAFAREIDRLDWMDAATKKRAMEKLSRMEYLIGYPSKWRSYDFPIDPKSWTRTGLAARTFDLSYDVGQIGKPVDRQRWEMTPPTVNAYYEGTMNHMVFPAGILQPPFFDVAANAPVNLGGMGMIVGHELTHGFDDKGSKFDAWGNLNDWWSPEVNRRFQEKTACIARQYSGYEAVPGVHLNGELTLGENIADNAGVLLAFEAYRALRTGAPVVQVAGGFDEDQQFFLAVGQAWCTKMTPDLARLRAQTDPHSLPRYRVDGSLSNLPAFADAFSCKEGSPMRRKDACEVW
jgi:predicted metalloendopeptidase